MYICVKYYISLCMSDILTKLKHVTADVELLYQEGEKHLKGNQLAGRRFRNTIGELSDKLKELRKVSMELTKKNQE